MPVASAVRKIILKVSSFIFIDLIGSKGALDKIFKTRDKFQVGTSFLVLAVSNLKDLKIEEIEGLRDRSMPVTCLIEPTTTVR